MPSVDEGAIHGETECHLRADVQLPYVHQRWFQLATRDYLRQLYDVSATAMADPGLDGTVRTRDYNVRYSKDIAGLPVLDEALVVS